MIKKYKKIALILIALMLMLYTYFAIHSNYLIKVGKTKFTTADFYEYLEIKKIAYDYKDIEEDENVLKIIKFSVLEELKNDALFLEFARENSIKVDKEELANYIDEIKSSYPKDTFSEVFTENAINYNAWERQLKNDIIIEKVIKLKITDNIEIEKKEFLKYYATYIKENNFEKTKENENTILNLFKNDKKEKEIKLFLKELQKNMVLEINEKNWKRIINEK